MTTQRETFFVGLHKPLHQEEHAVGKFTKVGEDSCKEGWRVGTVTRQLLSFSDVNEGTVGAELQIGAVQDRLGREVHLRIRVGESRLSKFGYEGKRGDRMADGGGVKARDVDPAELAREGSEL